LDLEDDVRRQQSQKGDVEENEWKSTQMIGSCRVVNSRMSAGRRRVNGAGLTSAGFSCLGLKKSV